MVLMRSRPRAKPFVFRENAALSIPSRPLTASSIRVQISRSTLRRASTMAAVRSMTKGMFLTHRSVNFCM